MPGVDDCFFTTTHPSLSGLKRLPSQRIFYGTAGEWVWLRAGLAVRPVRVSLLVAGYVALFSRMSEPSLPFTARGRFGDTRSRLAAGSGWRKPQDPTHCSRQVWGMVQSLLEAGLNPNTAGLPDIRREGGRTGQTTTDDSTSNIKTTTQKPLPLNTSPDRRRLPSISGGRCYIPPVGDYVLWVLGLPGRP